MTMQLPKHIKALAAAALISLPAVAQNTNSGYFVDDYTYRFQSNPAFANSKNFVAMPGLGNVNVAMQGNLHVRDVIYNVDGRTTTFLNPAISVEEVMKNISDKNRIGADVKLPVLAFGFKAFKGYNTVAVNARASVAAQLPRSLFSLLKEGASNTSYDLSDTRARATAYAEIALGHSHEITKRLRVGGTLKFLVGAGDMDARFDKATLSLGTDNWSVTSNATLNSSVRNLRYKTAVNHHSGHTYVDGMDLDKFGMNGFGMAVDLGAAYQVIPDLEISAAILDLGFISWNKNYLATTNGDKTFNTDRYTFSADENADNSFKNQWDNIRDDISAIYELEDAGETGGRTTALGATLNIGARYALPVYRNLKFGLLNTTRIQGEYTYTDFRLSANVSPLKWLDGGVNMSAGTFGVGFGWLVNIHPGCFNFFVGMDHTLGKTTKEFVPLSSNASVNLGLNFLF